MEIGLIQHFGGGFLYFRSNSMRQGKPVSIGRQRALSFRELEENGIYLGEGFGTMAIGGTWAEAIQALRRKGLSVDFLIWQDIFGAKWVISTDSPDIEKVTEDLLTFCDPNSQFFIDSIDNRVYMIEDDRKTLLDGWTCQGRREILNTARRIQASWGAKESQLIVRWKSRGWLIDAEKIGSYAEFWREIDPLSR